MILMNYLKLVQRRGMELKEIIISLIETNNEGFYWDFKEKFSSNNVDFLHDIICMANNLVDQDSYLIYGVRDDSRKFRIVGIENDVNRKNQNQIRQFLKDKKFSGGIRPTVYFNTIKIGMNELDIVIIKNENFTPYFLLEDFKEDTGSRKLKAFHIYTRVNDTNTDINNSADINHIEYLWRKRFGLHKSPLERVDYLLMEHSNWFKDLGNKNYLFNKSFPEFRIQLGALSTADEPARLFYINRNMFFGKMEIMYHSTILYEYEYWALDEFRRFVPKPQIDYIEHNKSIFYFYFYNTSELPGKLLVLFTNGDLNYSSRNPSIENEHFLIFTDKNDLEQFKEYYSNNFREIEIDNDLESLQIYKVSPEEDTMFFTSKHICMSIVAYRKWKRNLDH